MPGMDKVMRDNLIVKLRADGETIPTIAKELGCQRRLAKSSCKTTPTALSHEGTGHKAERLARIRRLGRASPKRLGLKALLKDVIQLVLFVRERVAQGTPVTDRAWRRGPSPICCQPLDHSQIVVMLSNDPTLIIRHP